MDFFAFKTLIKHCCVIYVISIETAKRMPRAQAFAMALGFGCRRLAQTEKRCCVFILHNFELINDR
jgi:hypothetical protein